MSKYTYFHKRISDWLRSKEAVKTHPLVTHLSLVKITKELTFSMKSIGLDIPPFSPMVVAWNIYRSYLDDSKYKWGKFRKPWLAMLVWHKVAEGDKKKGIPGISPFGTGADYEK